MDECRICGLVLAAGQSLRMRAFKPLLPLLGMTVIESAVSGLLGAGCERVVVVLGKRADELRALLYERFGDSVLFAENPDYATTDMLCSVQIGCRALPVCDAFFLLPGDMPMIAPSTYRALREAQSFAQAVIPVHGGRRGHPPLLSAALIPEILAYGGDGGLRAILSGKGIEEVPVEDQGILQDLDTPEDYQNARLATHYDE